MAALLRKAFSDMKESAKVQHQVDKANFAAAKAESKAQWEEAKAMGNPETHKKMMQVQRDAQIQEANERIAAAQKRVDEAQTPDNGKSSIVYSGLGVLLAGAVCAAAALVVKALKD